MTKPTALIAANELYNTPHAKTAHGLVRMTDRFRIVGVIDPSCAGQDAGTLLDGTHRGIPVFADLASALGSLAQRPDFCIVGVATHGGFLPEPIRAELLRAVGQGISIVSGMHRFLSEDPEFVGLAASTGATLVDVRKPRPRAELRFWDGSIDTIRTPTLAVLGTDCALGKRTTTQFLVAECRRAGIAAEMIYTGQTGWMQGARHGLILDTLPNDFVSGELEGAVLACVREQNPDLIVIEGQSSLRNPSGPCGAEILLSARARGVILQHAPARRYFDDYEHLELEIRPLAGELELIRMYDSRVLAICLNTQGLNPEQARAEQARLQSQTGLPVVLPLEDGVAALIDPVRTFMKEYEHPHH